MRKTPVLIFIIFTLVSGPYISSIEQDEAEQVVHNAISKEKEINAKVTFHDPCDLGRNSGIYEEPRKVLRAIPGIELVELAHNRESSMCCGGGGNVEMVNPELSARITQLKLDEIAKTSADMVVSSCQQCLRTIATRARRQKNPLAVRDLTELVVEAMI